MASNSPYCKSFIELHGHNGLALVHRFRFVWKLFEKLKLKSTNFLSSSSFLLDRKSGIGSPQSKTHIVSYSLIFFLQVMNIFILIYKLGKEFINDN